MPGDTPSRDAKLSDRMRAFAEGNDVPEGWREAADALDAATHGFFIAEPQTVSVRGFMGVWARTRRMWCERTGEPLIAPSSVMRSGRA